MAPKPVTALGQNISFFVVHDNDGAPPAPAPAPAPPQPSAKRQSNQPSITTHRRTPSLTPAELAAQAKRAEAARLSAAAAVRASRRSGGRRLRRRRHGRRRQQRRRRATPRRRSPPRTRCDARARDPAARAAGADAEATAAAAALAAKAAARRRLAEETRPSRQSRRRPVPGSRGARLGLGRALHGPAAARRWRPAPAFEMPAKMNDFILEGFRDRQAGSRAPPDESSSSDDDEDEAEPRLRKPGRRREQASGPRPEGAAATARPKRDRYYEEASDDDAAPPEAEVLESPRGTATVTGSGGTSCAKVGSGDLDQIRAAPRPCSPRASRRRRTPSGPRSRSSSSASRPSPSRASRRTSRGSAGRSLTRDPGWQRQDDEPTDVSYELDQAAAALELFETHVARAEARAAVGGAGEYFGKDVRTSAPYGHGSRKMLVFCILVDKSGITSEDRCHRGEIVVNKRTTSCRSPSSSSTGCPSTL
ncbi:short-chain alcohol dehydrogenase [Aureococcus anophagefferens]|uniref:Short-chain alcohol dehydrogenase n=1 Tax=Aureococcus anophagefferens TaxID=44056 RepID=A0ABR1G0U5_AURAN